MCSSMVNDDRYYGDAQEKKVKVLERETNPIA